MKYWKHWKSCEHWAILLLCILFAGCATQQQAQHTQSIDYLFHDYLFSTASERISVEDVFVLSDEMRRYLDAEIFPQFRVKGRQRSLFDALYSKGQLKLEYDATRTRNAAQTFDAKEGNCLSLVIMTAAFAKEIGLPVQYHSVLIDETWSRSGDIYFSNGHVNLTLGKRQADMRPGFDRSQLMTIDFLPPQDIAGQRTREINEQTIIAMYMNNRAAESLARGQLNDAYWWAREAIKQNPGFFASYNTLGVIYRRHGNMQEAQRTLSYAFGHEPENPGVLYNLVQVLNDLGRTAEAEALTLKLAQIEPHPPYHFFKLGKAAMQNGDFEKAKGLFAKEVSRDAYNHEFHFWLASAYFRLGEIKRANKHLEFAMEYSITRSDRDLYAAKLARLKAYRFN